MFYAVKYAYGAAVVNDGNRADEVYEFTSKRLRDAWVADGPMQDGPGFRASISARHPLVRNNPLGRHDGDDEAWYILARDRVDSSPRMSALRDVILDWPEANHLRWVATASEREILNWARHIH